jgi:ArsR family transcriptional regulator
MHHAAMDADHHPTQLLMACLGDASRFRIVSALLPGPRCVTELAAEVSLSQSCTTRHLQALERRGVVCGTREGKRVLYRLCADRPELEPLLAWALPAGAAVPAPDAPSPARHRRNRNGTPEGARNGRRGRPPSGSGSPAPATHEGAPGSAIRTESTPEPQPTLAIREAEPPVRPRPRPRSDLEDFLL